MTRIYRPPTRHLFSDAARRRAQWELARFLCGFLAVVLALLAVVFAIGAAEPGISSTLVSERWGVFAALSVSCVACLVISIWGGPK